MIKDTRYIIKRVIIGVLICLILSFIRTCEVHAETSLQTEILNYNREITATSGTDFNIFQSSNTLKNYGRGILQFNLVIYSYSANTSHLNNSLREVTVTSTNAIYTCNIGNAINNFDDETNYDVNLYTVLCDVNLGSSGLQRIDVKMVYNLSNKYTLRSSQYMTFIGNIDMSVLQSTNQVNSTLTALNSTLTNYLTSIYNAQVNTNNYLSSIENIVNTDLTTIINLMSTYTTSIINAINSGNAQAHTDAQAQQQATEDINDTLNDDNVDDSSSSINDMNSKIATNSVISDLLLLPVTLFQNILNSINGTCSPWNLGSLFGTNLVLPCINLSNLLGSALYGVIDVLLSGIFILSIRKKFVDIFQNITSLKDGGNQLE